MSPQAVEVIAEGENQQADGANSSAANCSFGSLPNVTGLTLNLIRDFHNKNLIVAVKNMKKSLSSFGQLISKIPVKFQSGVIV